MSSPFVHLRCHSVYSLSEGALRIDRIASMCRDLDMPAAGISDSDNVGGALEFSETLASRGVQPLIGATLRCDFGDSPDGSRGRIDRHDPRGDPRRLRVGLIALSAEGYANLRLLSSTGFLRRGGRDPFIGVEDLRSHSSGLACLTGGPGGVLDEALLAGRRDSALSRLSFLKDAFGDRLYIELQRHGLSEEESVEASLIELAYSLSVPLAASNEPYFASREDFKAHEILLRVAANQTERDEFSSSVTSEHSFKSPSEMRALFSDVPEALESVSEIARRCVFRPVPSSTSILPRFVSDSSSSEDDLLRDEAHSGLRRRLDEQGGASEGFSESDYFTRLDYEIDVISRMKYSGYFLIVADFVGWAKEQGIPVGPGRGSGAGSAVAWSLSITDLDPLRFKLLFERFLNPERISMPDFDIDFCQDRRDEVIEYVRERYGKDRVAQIISFGTLQPRQACRDVGRALSLPYGQVDRISKMIPFNPASPMTLSEALDSESSLRAEADADPEVRRMFDIGMRLEGLYRHASIHAAGVVIGDRPLIESVPLYADEADGFPATQFNMKWTEKAGLVKFDFLGLKTLTMLASAESFLRLKGDDTDLSRLPTDDSATFEMIASGRTVGVFQLESAGMKDLLRRARPDNLEDVIALVALYRPGPMENIPMYVDAKHGRRSAETLHELASPILADTYGVIIYQEQVVQIAQAVAGYSLGEADVLRRAMGKKDKSEMESQKARFVEGAQLNGVSRRRAERIFYLVDKFAGYGFNRAHTAAYGLLAYRTAWLKTHHPVEFVAASMSMELHNSDRLGALKQEADRLGVRLLPADVNRSEARFSVEDGAVRYALGALRNVGVSAVEGLARSRVEGGAFVDFHDVLRRCDSGIRNKRALESLAASGAFDSLHSEGYRRRSRLYDGIDAAIDRAEQHRKDSEAGQNALFGGGGGDSSSSSEGEDDDVLPRAAEWSRDEMLAKEREAIGFPLSGHPLDEALSRLREGDSPFVTWGELSEDSSSVSDGDEGREARMIGLVEGRRDRRSKRGDRYAYVALSDPSGRFEAACFSEALSRHDSLLRAGTRIAFTAGIDVDDDGEAVRLRILRASPLDSELSRGDSGDVGSFGRYERLDGIRLVLRDGANAEEALEALASRLRSSSSGRGRVRVAGRAPGDGESLDVELELGDRFDVSLELLESLRSLRSFSSVERLDG